MAKSGKAEILVGIASYNNAATIGHVVRAVDAGLAKYFPRKKAVIVNSDGGSTDGTVDVVREAGLDHEAAFIAHPVYPAHRITIPYSGIPGKGSAFRAIFEEAVKRGARACCVVDADLRSITPEWIELLLTPVIKGDYDFVAPLYSRHKYDGTITNSIVYPVTRALYGLKIRQPIGGDFGFSGKLARYYLNQDVWQSHVARFGIDIWMTTEAVAGGFRVCQTFLGSKIHDPKDPAANLAEMLMQVVITLFGLTEKHAPLWRRTNGTQDVKTFGFRYHVGLEPVEVDVKRMMDIFRAGVRDLKEIWTEILGTEKVTQLEEVAGRSPRAFRFSQGLWSLIIYDYAVAYHRRIMRPDHLVKSLTPLYLGKTASFITGVKRLGQDGAEEAIENICLEFEENKGYLVNRWQ